jgi:hypothetical protein
MKLTSNLWLAAVVALPCLPVMAQDPPTSNPPTYNSSSEIMFGADETSLDLFGSLSVGQEVINHLSRERVVDDGRLGAGLGVNHFFGRFVGLGADAYTENTQHSFVDNTSGSLILRIPFDAAHLAPYAFGGGGYQFDPTGVGFGHLGGGLDVRFARHVGLFVDARYVITDGTKNFGLGRFGIRISY